MKKEIISNAAPGAIGPYSQGIDIGDLIFCSGMLPIDPVTLEMKEGIQEQTKQSLDNIKGMLESQGLDLSHVVKTTVFLNDMNDFSAMNEVYAQYFKSPFPARSAIEVARLPKDALVEIEVVVKK